MYEGLQITMIGNVGGITKQNLQRLGNIRSDLIQRLQLFVHLKTKNFVYINLPMTFSFIFCFHISLIFTAFLSSFFVFHWSVLLQLMFHLHHISITDDINSYHPGDSETVRKIKEKITREITTESKVTKNGSWHELSLAKITCRTQEDNMYYI